ncbi:hypothetical protein EJ04DRAFT_68692 [Polyplosphaeria fusca]|uniref:Uncharacterized protein n=1 Tax=Polyplosphaeria fusca TaxID=682080 RepID=A0A9P4R6R6_9PLEO|nr:hypothetical protein EJ04DRAFT_68692 [Polyplosphaeria fusca]
MTTDIPGPVGLILTELIVSSLPQSTQVVTYFSTPEPILSAPTSAPTSSIVIITSVSASNSPKQTTFSTTTTSHPDTRQSSSSTPWPSPAPSKHELSSATKADVGLGDLLAVVALVAAVFLVWRRIKVRRSASVLAIKTEAWDQPELVRKTGVERGTKGATVGVQELPELSR